MSIHVSSPAFPSNDRIPTRYTHDGDNLSPPLEWKGVPAGTAELAIIVDDPDAPTREPFVHWVASGISPTTVWIGEGAEVGDAGENSFRRTGYDGPAPPPGHGVHHYRFHVYALDRTVPASGKRDKRSLMKAMKGHVLDEGELVGTYER